MGNYNIVKSLKNGVLEVQIFIRAGLVFVNITHNYEFITLLLLCVPAITPILWLLEVSKVGNCNVVKSIQKMEYYSYSSS